MSSATGGPTSKVYEYYYLRNRLRLVHDTSRLTRRQLVAANWRGSAGTIAASFRTRGRRDGASGGEGDRARLPRLRYATATGEFERL